LHKNNVVLKGWSVEVKGTVAMQGGVVKQLDVYWKERLP